MLPDDDVYVTIANFNNHHSTIDIEQQFHPTIKTAEVLISSVPGGVIRCMLSAIELQPYQALLLRINQEDLLN